mgnify:FL=1
MDEIGDILKKLDKDQTKGTKSENQPPEYESVKVDCDRCSDIGWFTEEVAIDHPDFGRFVICDCQENELNQKDNSQLQIFKK